jgi:hypothetical protein
MKYLEFISDGESKSGKTKVWIVQNKRGQPLGRVCWAGNFRGYAYAPTHQAIYDFNCLNHIAEFLIEANREHKTL